MSRMLEVEGLTKRFGPITAVDGVSFVVDRGEVAGFLGPNGAGKTTAMKLICGYLPATAGRAQVCGFDVATDPIEVKRRIGYLPEGAPLYEDMTPIGLLSFVADIRRFRDAAKSQAIERAIATAALESVVYQPIGTLSKGFKRRVGLAQAILHDPEVLILDEPTDGLDPNQKHDVRELIRTMAPHKAIVISTHILEEVAAVCTRAIIIDRGRVVADGTPAELQGRSRYHNAVRLRVPAAAADGVGRQLAALSSVADVERADGFDGGALLIALPVDGRMILDDVASRVREAGVRIEEISVEAGRLDEVFRHITTGE